MSVLREENTSREDYIQQYSGERTESGTEIETKISGLLSCSNFMINAENESYVQSLLKSSIMFYRMCNSV